MNAMPQHIESTPSPSAAHPASRGHSPWRAVLILAAAITLARVLYLFFLSPYDLSEDEAFYWDWSRNLDWSYNTKGPGIAWSIALATKLLGDTMPAVRMVAVVSAAVTMLASAGMAMQLMRARLAAGTIRGVDAADSVNASHAVATAGLIAAAIAALMPGFQIIGLLSTIDGPYVACWALASWAAARALTTTSRPAWLALGAAVAVGFLFKYTILLLPLGVLCYVYTNRRHLPRLPLPWVGGAICILLLGTLPVIIWNAQHDWASVKHLLAHLSIKLDAVPTSVPSTPPKPWTPLHLLSYLGAQVGVVGAAGLLMFASLRNISTQLERLWLCIAGVILFFYLTIATIQEAEGNWAIAGYISLISLSAVWATSHATSLAKRLNPTPPRLPFALWHFAIIAGLITGLGMLRLDLVRAALPAAVAKAIPIGRIIGARETAAAIDAELDKIRVSSRQEPFVMVEHYGKASLISFYLRGQPKVVCASSFIGGRHVQQDLWPDQRPDWPGLVGRPAIVVDSFDRLELWQGVFERVERLGELPGTYGRGTRFGFRCWGYRGMVAPTGGVGY